MKKNKNQTNIKLFKICDICGKEFQERGNNPEPITKGICCDKCNREYVLPVRLKLKEKGGKEKHDKN